MKSRLRDFLSDLRSSRSRDWRLCIIIKNKTSRSAEKFKIRSQLGTTKMTLWTMKMMFWWRFWFDTCEMANGKLNFESIVQMVYKLTLNSNFERRCGQQNQKLGVARPRCVTKSCQSLVKNQRKKEGKDIWSVSVPIELTFLPDSIDIEPWRLLSKDEKMFQKFIMILYFTKCRERWEYCASFG